MSLSVQDQRLLEASRHADVMDAAGRLIANPRRAMVSLTELLAMAIAIEQLQAVAIEAGLLVRALKIPETGDQHDMTVKDHAVQSQMNAVSAALAALDPETNTEANKQENDDAGVHS